MKTMPFLAAPLLALALAACTGTSTVNKKEATAPVQQVSTESNTAAAPVAQSTAEALPSFTLQDVSGNSLNMQSLKGKKVVVNLWATWCPPCRAELPSIEKLAKAVDKNKVAFVLLSLDDNFDKAKAFARRQRLSLPIFYPAENLPSLFNIQAIPTTFIFDETGKLIQRTDGGDDYDTPAYRKMLQ